LFLGIIATRGCNMACRYCAFGETADKSGMTLDTAKAAVDAYFGLFNGSSDRHREIHFFGGEPMFRPGLVAFVSGYARSIAVREGLVLHLEISTNGLCSQSRARAMGEQLDTVVLSIDGPPGVHDRNRPAPGGRATFDEVMRTAEILSDSSAELVIRSCVTQESLPLLSNWADTLASQLRPSAVCFERLTTTSLSESAGLRAPDPWEYARKVVAGSRRLERHGITAVTSTTDTSRIAATCCPVGQDALIVSPDGAVDACYLLEDQWLPKGLDLRLGHLDPEAPAFILDADAVDRVRTVAATHPRRCDGCISHLHCAGGCHVDHRAAPTTASGYDDLCISTRAITIAQLLDRCGQADLADAWLEAESDLRASVLQPSDLLVEAGA
jgi:radical SAM protein with 4Fe4S-binding SPASM domain